MWDSNFEKREMTNNLISKFYVSSKNINMYESIIEEKIDDNTFITKEIEIKKIYEIAKNDEAFVAKM